MDVPDPVAVLRNGGDRFASADDLTVSKPLSVVSRRTMAGIARAARATPRQLASALAADPPRASRTA